MRPCSILFLVFVIWMEPAFASEQQGWRIVFPNLHLSKKTDWIEGISVTVNCGHLESVDAIPLDWSVSIVRKSVLTEELRASADHGATRIPSLGRFNGGVRVTRVDPSCFDVSAVVSVTGESPREIRFSRRELSLLR